MNTVVHRAGKRGKGEHGWLSTRYSFSFADWYEPTRMGFGALRVLNDDTIAPKQGFGMHAHSDMEIITIPLSGTLTHKDSLGNTGTIRAGEVQVMSAGTGVVHSEYNDGDTSLSLFQIWIETKSSIAPRYDQKEIQENPEGLTLLVGPFEGPAPLAINQEAYISVGRIPAGGRLQYDRLKEGNGIYVFVITGEAEVADIALAERDALGVTETDSVTIEASSSARILIIEVPIEKI